ncbi:hypothetical protein SADUNF_Sadunf11G0103200 [Salix dunnii]|uniref:Uncharacterized protein n=1 Tax=Salix dunnii TaxID=1413687 RepID=A0A835JR45_9ROSI|nr:hypothetical protein SADUNF_Sadunf11G0103200 [Salix dunnii]
MNLKLWVKDSLPGGVAQIADATLKDHGQYPAAKKDCLSSILELALQCSAEQPEERIDIKDVLTTLKKIKANYDTISLPPAAMWNGCFLIPFTMILWHSFAATMVADRVTSNPIDQDALLALKNHIVDDHQNLLTKNWTTATSVCD